MRGLRDLIRTQDSAWPLVSEWIAGAGVPVEVLPREAPSAERVLVELQVTTRSVLGAVAFETGGILIDHGWVRVLGSGGPRMSGSLTSWNARKGEGFLIVAHDALGGMYALDGGAFGAGEGGAFYFAPDSLRWEDLDRGYSDLLAFLLSDNTRGFYEAQRWRGWEEEVGRLSPDQGLSLYPPLWSAEGKDVSKVSRRGISMTELFETQLAVAEQLGGRR